MMTRAVPIASGGDSFALFGGGRIGSVSAYTDKYAYATNAVAAGTVLGTASQSLAATGNSTVGIFGGGYTNVNSAYTDKYTYATHAAAAGTVLGVSRHALAACSSSPGGF